MTDTAEIIKIVCKSDSYLLRDLIFTAQRKHKCFSRFLITLWRLFINTVWIYKSRRIWNSRLIFTKNILCFSKLISVYRHFFDLIFSDRHLNRGIAAFHIVLQCDHRCIISDYCICVRFKLLDLKDKGWCAKDLQLSVDLFFYRYHTLHRLVFTFKLLNWCTCRGIDCESHLFTKCKSFWCLCFLKVICTPADIVNGYFTFCISSHCC